MSLVDLRRQESDCLFHESTRSLSREHSWI
uniref:Uncharacterized protein n=1 Tax=Arundo donax TaxID=35708 RepID=A0A0A9CDE2_ARUDO